MEDPSAEVEGDGQVRGAGSFRSVLLRSPLTAGDFQLTGGGEGGEGPRHIHVSADEGDFGTGG